MAPLNNKEEIGVTYWGTEQDPIQTCIEFCKEMLLYWSWPRYTKTFAVVVNLLTMYVSTGLSKIAFPYF